MTHVTAVTFLAIMLATGVAQAEPMHLSLINVRAIADAQYEKPFLVVRLTSESAELFARFSSENVGRQLDVSFEGMSLWRPYLSEPIVNGYLQLFPGLDDAAARELADRMSIAGAIEVDYLQLR